MSAKYAEIKQAILQTPKCPDGHSIDGCASCVADRLARLQANRCFYCRDARITRALKLRFDTFILLHLVCDKCADSLDGEVAKFEKSEDQI